MIRWSAGRPAVVWATSFALLAAGGLAFARLPLATRPVVELPRLMVTASWPGASAELVESYLTSPLESAIQAVRDVKKVSSESSDGRTRITIDLEEQANVQMARLGILERIELLRPEFPDGATSPYVGNYVPEELSEQSLLQYTVYGPYTPATLVKLVEEQIKPRISAVEGVAGVDASSAAEIRIAVTYDGQRLRQLGIPPEALREAIGNARMVDAIGKERSGSTERPVVLRDQPKVIEDLAVLPVQGPGGRIFQVGELAEIRLEEDSRDMFYRVNGVPAVGLDIARLPGADAVKTAARARQAMDDLKRVLPPGVRLEVRSDESIELGKQLNDLLLRGGIAFASVMLVLILSLKNTKSVLLVMGSAAIAIAGTALGLYIMEIPANLLTLAGLGMGIGILVQNGVVVVERLRLAPDTVAGRSQAGTRIFPAVLGSTLTTAVVLLPFLYLQGNARAAFVPFAVAFILALGWSIVSSVIMIPALAAGHGIRTGHWPRLSRLYSRIVIASLRWRAATLTLAVLLMAVATWGFVKKVPKSSFGFGNWFGQRTTLMASLSFPRGSDPSSLDRAMREFESLAVGAEGVEQVEAMGNPDGARMVVTFTRESQYGPAPYVMEELLTQRAILIGGASVGVRGNGPGFFSGGGGSSSSFQIKVLGYSFTGVEQLATDLKRRLERIPRVKDVDINAASFWQREKAFSVTLNPDRQALARFGLTAQDLAAAVNREVRGPVGATELEIGGEKILVNVKDAGARERTLDQLREAILPNGTNTPARIVDVANVSEREALTTINREDQQYVRLVTYEFRGPQKLANRTHEAFMKSIAVPPGYSVADNEFDWGQDESGKGLWLVFAIGIVMVLLVVMMVFNSGWAAGIVFISLPLALAGSAAAFWIAGASFSREAAVGVILVVGLAVNHIILLIDAALGRRTGGQADSRTAKGLQKPQDIAQTEAVAVRLSDSPPVRLVRRGLSGYDVLWACQDRAAIIVLTTLTTLASLIPLAVGTNADELFGSIALATVGGTIAGTLGALFFVPAMILGRGGKRRRNSGKRVWWLYQMRPMRG
jgi:multidrug efflux pump subunit AcrB